MTFKDASKALDALGANIEWGEGNKLEVTDDIYRGKFKFFMFTPINVIHIFQFVSFASINICSKNIKLHGGSLNSTIGPDHLELITFDKKF